MAESHDTLRDTAQTTWKRRGLFAAAAALVAGLVARVSEQRVEAGTDGDVVLGAANTTPGITSITNTTPNSDGLDVTCTAGFLGYGLNALGSGYGVAGNNTGGSAAGAGVSGQSFRADNFGVWGNNPNGVGVRGQSIFGTGMLGASTSGVGVFGNIPATSSAATIAIYGANNSSWAGTVPGAGGFGIVGVSQNGHGLVGGTNAAGAAAVVGSANGVAGAYGAVFYGPVVVEGNFTVIGGAKSAAVPHPDGTHRRLYCVESPESWFEDFGKGQLECGQADVTLDPDFAAVVHLDDYHVFLTQYGGHDDLSVSEQTPRGFRVEAKEGSSSSRFSWRVVANRKDIASPRFEPVSVPPKPEMPTIPDPPAIPTPPAMRRHH